MTAKNPDPPSGDPQWWRRLPWWEFVGLVLVNAFKAPGKRWWIQWAIGVLLFAGVITAALIYFTYFPPARLHE